MEFKSDQFRFFVLIIILGSFGYFLDTIVQATAWKLMLEWFEGTPKPFFAIYSVFGRSQIAKYLPGNIFHIANRHFLSLNEGVKNAPLIGAATFELLGYLLTSAFLCLLGFLLGITYIGLPVNRILLIVILAIIFLAFLIIAIPKILPHIPMVNNFFKEIQINKKSGKESIVSLVPIVASFLGYLLLAGLIFSAITYTINADGGGLFFPTVISVYSIAYLAGLITPGAPAGIGIRETIIVLLLSPYIGESKATLVSMLFRLVTTLGDVWFFLAAVLVGILNRKIKNSN
ncbi:MAG: lysylphosphatidylglycerol synthase domain-containing protein [Anaerolineaceae bacterium]